MRWLVFVAFSVATWHRATLYQSNLALWQDTVIHAPTFRALANYRNALMGSGDLEAAIGLCPHLARAVTTDSELAILQRLCLGAPYSPSSFISRP